LKKPEQLSDEKMVEIWAKQKEKRYTRYNGLTQIFPPPPPEKIVPKNIQDFPMPSPNRSGIVEVTMSLEESLVDDE
jgi:hypothetical protein